MKTRNGFVSNSSSSSFIVAFPHKPKNVIDVINMLYKGDPNYKIGVGYGEETVNALDAANSIFEEIKNKKPATIKEMIEELQTRYYYNVYTNCYSFQDGGMVDEHGWGSNLREPYFGVDKKTLDELARISIENDRKRSDRIKKTNEIEQEYLKSKNFPLEPPSKDYQSKEVKAYWKKRDALLDEMRKTKEYKEFESADDYWSTTDKGSKLSKKLAEADAKAFKKDHKKSFITILTYSDNDGSFNSVMEHGNTFDNVHHIAISHH